MTVISGTFVKARRAGPGDEASTPDGESFTSDGWLAVEDASRLLAPAEGASLRFIPSPSITQMRLGRPDFGHNDHQEDLEVGADETWVSWEVLLG